MPCSLQAMHVPAQKNQRIHPGSYGTSVLVYGTLKTFKTITPVFQFLLHLTWFTRQPRQFTYFLWITIPPRCVFMLRSWEPIAYRRDMFNICLEKLPQQCTYSAKWFGLEWWWAFTLIHGYKLHLHSAMLIVCHQIYSLFNFCMHNCHSYYLYSFKSIILNAFNNFSSDISNKRCLRSKCIPNYINVQWCTIWALIMACFT